MSTQRRTSRVLLISIAEDNEISFQEGEKVMDIVRTASSHAPLQQILIHACRKRSTLIGMWEAIPTAKGVCSLETMLRKIEPQKAMRTTCAKAVNRVTKAKAVEKFASYGSASIGQPECSTCNTYLVYEVSSSQSASAITVAG